MRISRRWRWACLTAFLMILPATSPTAETGRLRPPPIPTPNRVPQGAPVRSDGNYGNLPLAFEPNIGQTAPEVLFLARGGGMTAFFTDAETVMVLGGSEPAVVRMKLAGATKPRQATGLEKLPGVSNYFIGNDPKNWRTDVPHYARIQYEGVYPGIDLEWYGNQRQLEYDFVVAAGADPKQIQVAYEGVESVGVEAGGALVLRTALGEVRQQRPRVYQEIGGKRVEVGARYAIAARNRVSFELASYDRKRELRIDPVVLVYSTYLGGSGSDAGYGIAVDSAGSAYVTGYTQSVNFPTQLAYQGTYRGGSFDVIVTRLSPAGDALVYSTYLGGSGDEYGQGIAVDGAGSAYVTGSTDSTNFPTQLPYQATAQGRGDAFVTKLAPAGNALVYSTYLGGSLAEEGKGIAVDPAGSAYVTGYTYSANFPTLSAYQATSPGYHDAFVTKLTPAGSALVYSTYLGGSADNDGRGIAVDGAGSAYVTGYTDSSNFPTQLPYQATRRGLDDAFVTKLAPAGNALVYSTYLGGGDYDQGYGVAVDTAGSAHVTGRTSSTNFPTQSPYQATLPGGPTDAFVTKLSPAGNALVYSTYLGGGGTDLGRGIAVDTAGSAYVAGWTDSVNFPTQSAYQATRQGDYDAFVTKLSLAGNTLLYSTYLGGSLSDDGYGIAVDGVGSAYVTGFTASFNFPTQSPYQGTFQGGSADAFVTKLQLPVTVAIYAVLDSASARPTIAPNSFASIYGSGFTTWTGDWTGAILNGMLPTTLGGVQVRINGKDSYTNYASSSQLNVLTPFDTASGSMLVEVITAQGTAPANAVMAPVAPALFGYTVGGRFYAVAQIATDMTILVAPVGTFPRPCRPAHAGDYLAMWVQGMGSTNPEAPAGRVLATAYPIADLSRVRVRFGSVEARVDWAGLVMAGLFQVNVEVPAGLSGDQLVVLTVDGQSTQANAFLNFQ